MLMNYHLQSLNNLNRVMLTLVWYKISNLARAGVAVSDRLVWGALFSFSNLELHRTFQEDIA